MMSRGLVRGGWIGSGALVLGFWASSAPAQFAEATGAPIVLGSPVPMATGPRVVQAQPTAVATPAPRATRPGLVPNSGGLGVEYATPPFSEARRRARVANRYTVARPVYAGRPGVSFAPFSDYYFPRVIGARETVFTAPAGGAVPVGEAAFRTPSPTDVPVFPRDPKIKKR